MTFKKFILTFFLFLSTQSVWAQWYYGPGIGYSRFSNDRIKTYDQVSAGPRFGALVGFHLTPSPIAAEVFYNYTSTKTDELKYNSGRYVYHAKYQTLGFVGKYFIEMFHVRLGYAFHHFNTFITDYVTGGPVTNSAIDQEFGVVGKKFYSGPLFGAGMDIPLGTLTPYIVVTSYQLNSSNSDIFELEGGLKFSF
ncbi:MAG: hypothetical protein ACOYL6_10735 [Bacteriovoracaceae bacterium]